MRALLAVVLIHGLAPGLSEVVEAGVHLARTGHAAHSAEDRGDLGDQGAEHGCGTTQHRCTCCAAQAVVAPGAAAVDSIDAASSPAPAAGERTIAVRDPARPFRPPIS